MDFDHALNDGPSFNAFLAQLVGKTIAKAEGDNSASDDWLILTFTDGTSARIRHDWIYEARFTERPE